MISFVTFNALYNQYIICFIQLIISLCDFTGEEVSIDKQVACEECPRWLKMTEVACEKTEVAVC